MKRSEDLKAGDPVTGPDGTKLVVVHTPAPEAPGALCETAEGVEPYRSAWYAKTALKRRRASSKDADA